MKRRDFIKTESVAGAAVLMAAGGVFAGTAASVQQQSVVDGLSGYSDRVALRSTGDEVCIVASIDHIDAYIDPDVQSRALPYQNIRAEGNTLSFMHQGVRYTLENVLPQQFDAQTESAGDFKRITLGI